MADQAATARLVRLLDGCTPRLLSGGDKHRYHRLKDAYGIRHIPCVIDDDPDMVMQATALGTDGIIFDLPANRYFSWHLRATGTDDAARGITQCIKIWKDKRRMRFA